ncbi:hypothetical protein QQ045_015633 [Rhodiola kirilowii]
MSTNRATRDLLEPLLSPPPPPHNSFPVDFVETRTGYIIQADVAGVKQHELRIRLVKNVIEISFERKPPKMENGERKLVSEFTRGKFGRKFVVPEDKVKTDKQLKAVLEAGVLTVTIGK